MSVCTRCGTAYVPGAQFCSTCGFAFAPHSVNPVIILPPPPLGTTKAVIGPSPISEIIGGIMAIVFAAIFGSISPFFGPIAIIMGIIGVVLLALGAMGISIPQQQVTYQTSSTSSYVRAGDSAYDYTPKSFLKPCPRCGQEIPIAALSCYHCGAVF